MQIVPGTVYLHERKEHSGLCDHQIILVGFTLKHTPGSHGGTHTSISLKMNYGKEPGETEENTKFYGFSSRNFTPQILLHHRGEMAIEFPAKFEGSGIYSLLQRCPASVPLENLMNTADCWKSHIHRAIQNYLASQAQLIVTREDNLALFNLQFGDWLSKQRLDVSEIQDYLIPTEPTPKQ